MRKPGMKLTHLSACLALALSGGVAAKGNDDPVQVMFAHQSKAQTLHVRAFPRLAHRPAATPSGGANLPVTNCLDDSSAGSLRSVIAAAASGDTIDMSAL